MKKNKTPKIGEWILKQFLLNEEFQEKLGDFEEGFILKQEESGWLRARIWYWSQLLFVIPVLIENFFYWSFVMIRNYLLITFRTLLKHKGFSIINIFGLALSIAVCLMIMIFIRDWKSSDQFHEKKNRIIHVYTTDVTDSWDQDGSAMTAGYLAPYLRNSFSFIEDAVILRQMGANVLNTETAVFLGGLYAEPSFLNIFSYPMKDGDPETALNDPYSIVISEEAALKFFGDEDPMNKTLTLENMGEFTVTGVLEDQDLKSHFIFDALISFATVISLENSGVFESDMNQWSSFNRYYTYVLLKDEDDRSLFEEQLPQIENSVIPEEEQERFGFKIQKLTDINLGINLSNTMPGVKPRLDIFFIPFLAALVMFLACFNYIILSVARSLKRTKEIGLRKVIGATRGQVVKLFLCETTTITLLALVAACFLIMWLIPMFNSIDAIENTKMQINIEKMKDPGLYVNFLLLALAVSLFAGLYPALYLSSFKPVNALQGLSRIKGFSHLLARKILMSIQFGVSLIAVIFIVYFYQLHTYWLDYDRGIETENFVSVYLRDVNPETFRNEIMSNSNVAGVSFSSAAPVYGGMNYKRLRTENIDEPKYAFYYSFDTGFIENFGLELVAGRNFSDEFSTDREKGILINETAVRILNLGSPEEAVGKDILFNEDKNVTVIGVMKDFYFRKHMENRLDPLLALYRPDEFRYANIRYLSGKKEEIKENLPDLWKKFDKVHPVYYMFFDEEQKEIDSQIGGTIGISAGSSVFVILIALFGLLGMASYTTEMRVKEIGIRKVLGANVLSVAYLLSKSYLKLIIYTSLFAVPAAYFGTDALFQFFAIKPGMNLWVPPAALVFILALAVITIGSQTIRAAIANPVDTLKEE